jgi:hypothetical protein
VEVTIVTSGTEDLHVEVDEKHTVAKASETRQYAEYELIAATSVDINGPSIGDKVTTVHESDHDRFERIDVQVCLGEL